MNNKPSKKSFYAAIGGIVLIGICCFTPILVIILGAIGLSAFTTYLDYVLIPALIILIVLAWLSYRKFKKNQHEVKPLFSQVVFILPGNFRIPRFVSLFPGTDFCKWQF